MLMQLWALHKPVKQHVCPGLTIRTLSQQVLPIALVLMLGMWLKVSAHQPNQLVEQERIKQMLVKILVIMLVKDTMLMQLWELHKPVKQLVQQERTIQTLNQQVLLIVFMQMLDSMLMQLWELHKPVKQHVCQVRTIRTQVRSLTLADMQMLDIMFQVMQKPVKRLVQ
jgi:hypothetical protein